MVLNIRPELAEEILNLANARGQDVETMLVDAIGQLRQTAQQETIEQTVNRVIMENKQLLDALANR